MGRESGVSFIVTVFNKAHCLEATLHALAAQQGDFEREYIFIDDGSTDNSVHLIREFTRGWPNVMIVRQANLGAAHATNAGIDRASLPFVKLLDADDILAPHATRVLLEVIERTEACMAIGQAAYHVSLSELTAFDCSATDARIVPDPLREVVCNSMLNPSQCLVRTEAARAVGGCDHRVPFCQLSSLALRLAMRWPIARTSRITTHVIRNLRGQVSLNAGRHMQWDTLAQAYFLRDHRDVPEQVKRLAFKRAADKAWNWLQESGAARVSSRYFWIRMLAFLPFRLNYARWVERTAAAFDTAPRAECGLDFY